MVAHALDDGGGARVAHAEALPHLAPDEDFAACGAIEDDVARDDLVLGPTGRNFGAGMSGGIAYVYDPDRSFGKRFNPEMVDAEPLDPSDSFLVHSLVERHLVETESAVAARLLENWDTEVLEFVKVMPSDYRRILEATRQAEAEGRSLDEAVMEAAHG